MGNDVAVIVLFVPLSEPEETHERVHTSAGDLTRACNNITQQSIITKSILTVSKSYKTELLLCTFYINMQDNI